MRLPEFDPRAIQVEDQRGQTVEPEGFWGTALRGVGRNWQEGGLAGLLGLGKWLGPAPAPIRTFDGQVFDLPASIGDRPLQIGALPTTRLDLKAGAV